MEFRPNRYFGLETSEDGPPGNQRNTDDEPGGKSSNIGLFHDPANLFP